MRFEMVLLAVFLSIAARLAPSARLGLSCLLLAGYCYARSLACRFILFDFLIEIASSVLYIYVLLSKRPVSFDKFTNFLHGFMGLLIFAHGVLVASGSAFSDVPLGVLIPAVGFHLIGTVQAMSSTSWEDAQSGSSGV